MTIQLTYWNQSSAVGEYNGNNIICSIICEADGVYNKFNTAKEAKLALIDQAFKVKIINQAQWLVYRSHVLSPRSQDFYEKIRKKRKVRLKCKVKGCENKHRAMGYCNSHYHKQKYKKNKSKTSNSIKSKYNNLIKKLGKI